MKTKTLLILAALALIPLMAGCGRNTGFLIKPIPIEEKLEETTVEQDDGLLVTDKIAIIDVDGLIMNARIGGLLGSDENPTTLFIEKVDKAQLDSNVKAVVLRINSPGGGVTASDIMLQRLLQFRSERKVPVVAIIEDVGASGGYYLACGSDTIMAMPTSITGSIGVIVQTFSLAGTMDKLGITAKAITSGEYKDMGSPFKPLESKDQALLQQIVNDYYARFVKVVANGRPKLGPEQVRKLADGRVYTGEQALANGLIDALSYVDQAVATAKKLGNIRKARVVIYHRPLGYKANIYSQAQPNQPKVSLVNVDLPNMADLAQPHFLYLWTGHAPVK